MFRVEIWSNNERQWVFLRLFKTERAAVASMRNWERDGYKARMVSVN